MVTKSVIVDGSKYDDATKLAVVELPIAKFQPKRITKPNGIPRPTVDELQP